MPATFCFNIFVLREEHLTFDIAIIQELLENLGAMLKDLNTITQQTP